MAKKHSKLSPSGASRWINCTKAPEMEEGFPNGSSPYAEEGTAAHEVAELTAKYWLGEITERVFENRRDKLAKGEYYNQEMQECANDWGKMIKEKLEETRKDCPDAVVELEVKLDISKHVPKCSGTADCVIISDGMLEVIDFKYGKGVLVSAEDNAQMRLYALGAYEKYNLVYDIEEVKTTIFQPRKSAFPDSETLTVGDLLTWSDTKISKQAEAAYNHKGEFNPSDETCRWCKAREICKARTGENLKLIDLIKDVKGDTITAEKAGEILQQVGDLDSWVKDLRSIVQSTIEEGEPVTGWKIVEGRSIRTLSDFKEAHRKLVNAGYDEPLLWKPREMLTLAQLEKDFGKKAIGELLGDLIIKPQGKPTLAPETDKRSEFKSNDQILNDFDE